MPFGRDTCDLSNNVIDRAEVSPSRGRFAGRNPDQSTTMNSNTSLLVFTRCQHSTMSRRDAADRQIRSQNVQNDHRHKRKMAVQVH